MECPKCFSNDNVEKGVEGDTYFHCNNCNYTVENGVETSRSDRDFYCADYPARKKAIEILELLLDKELLSPKCRNEKWYEMEDELTSIIDRKEN